MIGTHSASTTVAKPTRRPAAVSCRVSGPLGSRWPGQVWTTRPHSRTRSRPSADSRARYPAIPRLNTTTSPNHPGLAMVVSGTQNSTSSGRPAIAGLRSRTASRSVTAAMIPIPAAASSASSLVAGTGGANLAVSEFAIPTISSRWPAEAGVGISQ